MKKTIDFDPEFWDESNEIIIYGASKYGEIGYYLLLQYGLKPTYFCDKAVSNKFFLEVPVITPKELKCHLGAGVIIASADCFHEIRDILEKVGIKRIYDMCLMLDETPLQTELLRPRTADIYHNRQNYIDVANQDLNSNFVNFSRIQFVVSERCSLKCRDCTHLMQYYKTPHDIDIYEYKESFELLLSVTNSISEIRILGGEPFMNRNMHKIFDWWNNIEKIGIFTIYTNGTIIPTEDCLQTLSRSKVRIRISNYRINADSIKRLETALKKHKIDYYICSYDDWQDAGDLHYRNNTTEQMKNVFATCFERNCITFFKGQLHRCPRSAHAMNLRAMPDVHNDYVNLYSWSRSREELISSIKTLQKRDWIEACNYCDGPNSRTQHIPVAMQIKKPREYIEISNM